MEALALPVVATRKKSGTAPKGEPAPSKHAPWPAHLGDLLYVEMRKRGWVQERLAEHFGVAQSTVARWLDGSVRPNPKRVEQIAEFCEVDMATAMRLNFKLSDPATEAASTAARLTQMETAIGDLAQEMETLRNQVEMGNELVAQLLRKVKSGRER